MTCLVMRELFGLNILACCMSMVLNCSSAQAWQSQPSDPGTSSSSNVIVAMGLVDVEQGVTRITSEMSGRIVRIDVKENQLCKEGAPLLAVDDSHLKLKLAQARLALEVARGKVKQSKAGRQIVEAEKRAQEIVIETAENREQISNTRLTAAKKLEVSNTTLRELETIVSDSGMIVKGEKQKLLIVERKLQYAMTEEEQAALHVQVHEEQIREIEKSISDCILKAPINGRVLRVRARLGEFVGPGAVEPLVELCPEGSFIVRAEITQEFAHAAKVGQACKITDDSRTNSTVWNGRIQRLSNWFVPRRSILFEPLQMNDVRTLECITTLDPTDQPLRIGQRVRLSISTSSTPSDSATIRINGETKR